MVREVDIEEGRDWERGEHRMLTIDGFHFVRNRGRGIVTEPRTDVYIRRTGHEDTGEYRCFLFNTASCYTEYQQTWCRIDILNETIRMKGVVSTLHLAIRKEIRIALDLQYQHMIDRL